MRPILLTNSRMNEPSVRDISRTNQFPIPREFEFQLLMMPNIAGVLSANEANHASHSSVLVVTECEVSLRYIFHTYGHSWK